MIRAGSSKGSSKGRVEEIWPHTTHSLLQAIFRQFTHLKSILFDFTE